MTDTPEGVSVTNHGRRRVKQRVKLPPRAALRLARKAFLEGIEGDHPSLTPPLRAAVANAKNRPAGPQGAAQYFRVYRGALYIYSAQETLITVLSGFDDEHRAGIPRKDKEDMVYVKGQRLRSHLGRRPRGDVAGDDE